MRIPSFSMNSMTVYFLIFILTIGSSSLAAVTSKNSGGQLNVESTPDQTENLLYTVLVAEIATSRGFKNIACESYFKAAYLSKDPAIAEQATLVSINFEAPKESVLNALLWAKIDPDNLQAQLIAMTLLISQSVEQAIPYLTRAIDINPQEIDQHLMEIQTRLSETSAINLQQALDKIAKERPLDPYTQFAAAQSASIQNDMKKTKFWLNSALKLKPDLTRAIELNAQIIRYEDGNDAPALQYLNQEVEKFPNDGELRIFYANALLDTNKIEEAKKVIGHIAKESPFQDQALLLLGEIYLNEKNWAKAESSLEKALNYPNAKQTAKYLLGEIAEEQQHYSQAINWFSDVGQGPFHVPARLRAVMLLKKAKLYEEAIYLLHNSSPNNLEEQKYLLLSEIDLLNASKGSEDALQISNELLLQLPEDLDVLFMRAVTATKLKKWDMAEDDFKKVLVKNPNDANVLNALGYTISYDKKRLQEALSYSKQALSVSPNNPDFMDSVGWIYFQLGDIQQALKFLTEANALSQDNTIAAHFGEVLWASDQKKEAVIVWKKALKQEADNEELLDTLKRLKIDLDKNH